MNYLNFGKCALALVLMCCMLLGCDKPQPAAIVDYYYQYHVFHNNAGQDVNVVFTFLYFDTDRQEQEISKTISVKSGQEYKLNQPLQYAVDAETVAADETTIWDILRECRAVEYVLVDGSRRTFYNPLLSSETPSPDNIFLEGNHVVEEIYASEDPVKQNGTYVYRYYITDEVLAAAK